MRDPFPIVEPREHGVFIPCDPEAVSDLAEACNHLIALMRCLRVRFRAMEAERRLAPEQAAERARIAFEDEARQVFESFRECLETGQTEKAALREVRGLYHLQAIDARFLVREGKKLSSV